MVNSSTSITLPTIAFSKTLPAFTNATNETIDFNVSPSSTSTTITQVQCTLDAQPIATCANQFSATALADGMHTLIVQATDSLNHVATAQQTWSVDTVLPVTTINMGPASITNQTAANFVFSSTDASSGVATTECSLDGAPSLACASPLPMTGLAAGVHSFSVQSTDKAGNASLLANFSWTIDLTAPTVKILTMPDAISYTPTATFTFSGTDVPATAVAAFTCTLDKTTAACDNGQATYSNLTVGPHTFSVVGKDLANNNSAAAAYTWTVNAAPPVPTKFTKITLSSTNPSGIDSVNTVYVDGNNIYAGTGAGLAISNDGGATFTLATMANGLSNGRGGASVLDVSASGNYVFASTFAPNIVSVSTDGGKTFVSKNTLANGTPVSQYGANSYSVFFDGTTLYTGNAGSLGYCISKDKGGTFSQGSLAGVLDAWTLSFFTSGNNVYIGTDGRVESGSMIGGLSISTNGGTTFTTKNMRNGLGDNSVNSVYAVGSTIYAGTLGGVSISTDGGSTFINKTTINGLGNNSVNKVLAIGNTVYAATGTNKTFQPNKTGTGGLSISTDGGNTFINKTTANGLGSNLVTGFAVVGNTLYVSTLGGLYKGQ